MWVQRRNVIAGIGLLGVAGIARAQLPDVPACLEKQAAGRFSIDAHCHVFNGSDLQVERFLVDVAAGELIAPLRRVVSALAKPLQRSVWKRAPRAKAELNRLEGLGTGITLGRSNSAALTAAVAAARAETDKNFSEGFAEELKTPEGERFSQAYQEYLDFVAAQSSDAAKAIQSLTRDAELTRLGDPNAVLRQLETEKKFADLSLSAVFTFIRGFYAYRFEHVYYLLQNYGCAHGTVRMIAPALVDYDYPLGARNTPTPSALPEQYQVMARIAEIFQGRVLTYLPFDPWRYVLEDDKAFQAAQDFIVSGAAIGIKLYPPMGFAPLGNAGLLRPPHSWPTDVPEFGRKLDDAMNHLWDFATKYDVPVIAHANMSNYPSADRAGLGSPDNWRTAFTAHPTARVCFGHFGGEDLLDAENQWPQGFLDLVGEYANAYGDISYFEQILGRYAARGMKRRLADFLKPPGKAASKMLYGSDWEMLGIEAHSELYFDKMAKALIDPAQPNSKVPPQVLSLNAQSFLGLHRNQASRARLEKFYDLRQVDATWIRDIT